MSTKYISCDEDSQIFNWQFTTKKAKQLNFNSKDTSKYKGYKPSTGFKKLKGDK